MKTKHTLFCRAVLAIFASLLLNACGPGTGGTGTGPVTVIASAPATTPSTSPTTSPILTGPNGNDNRLGIYGLWSSSTTQGQVFFDPQHIVFRKGCFYFEFVGQWSVKTEQNSDLTIVASAEGYTWSARLSNSKLAISVTDSGGNVVLADALLSQASMPQLKPTPSSVCED
jgi:hypothetical protein